MRIDPDRTIEGFSSSASNIMKQDGAYERGRTTSAGSPPAKEVSDAWRFLSSLHTQAPALEYGVEAEKARERSRARFRAGGVRRAPPNG